VAYLIGSHNNAYMIAYFKGINLRAIGSGNLGTMNVTRALGQKWGWVTLCLDALKSAIPCLFGWWLLGGTPGFDASLKAGWLGFDNYDKAGIFVAGIAAVIGHVFPIYFKFKGGKGVASSIGVMLVANPIATVLSFAAGLTFIYITNIGSITSFIVLCGPMVYESYIQRLSNSTPEVSILILVLFMIVLLAHHQNIIKLFKYTEKPVVTSRVKKKE